MEIPNIFIPDEFQWLGEKFTPGMAWVDLHVLGENRPPIRKLAARWNWSNDRVVRFLAKADRLYSQVHQQVQRQVQEQVQNNISKSASYKESKYSDKYSDKYTHKYKKEHPLDSPSPDPTLPFPSETPHTNTPVTTPPIIPQEKQANAREDVEKIYKLYPTKCPVRGRPTGKSSVDKKKIERLLKTMSANKLEETITRYLRECVESQTPIKNLSTFLNNLPDYDETEQVPEKKPEEKPQASKSTFTFVGVPRG